MAYNDMEVIMYKILKYLYECMKAGVRPREEDFCAGSKLIGDIPGSYWDQLDYGKKMAYSITKTEN